MMAISTAIHEYKTHPEVAIPLTQEFLKIKDADAMKAAYESYSQHVYPDIPRPSLKGMELVLQEMSKDVPKAASVKPADLVDTSTLDELEREGFFKKLQM
jgi:NitT/TauT family transport system substrate-binding protein